MATSGRTARPRVAVAKFASCDGCQLTLLDLEDQLLEIVTRFDIVEFPEATSRRSPGPYDIVFVEGSISAPEHIDQVKELRKQARVLVTIGACATAGGIQALRNWADHDAYRATVYAHPEWIESLATATAVADHVKRGDYSWYLHALHPDYLLFGHPPRADLENMVGEPWFERMYGLETVVSVPSGAAAVYRRLQP